MSRDDDQQAYPEPAARSRSLSQRRARLELERERLRRRSVQLRERIAHQAMVLNPALRAADTARGVGDWVRQHPLVLVGGVFALFALRPRRVLSLGLRLWGGWRAFERVAPLLGVMLDAAGLTPVRRRR